MQTIQTNIIYAAGRITIDRNTPKQMSAPFSQVQYREPNESYENGSLFFPFIRDGKILVSMNIPIEHMDIKKHILPEGQAVEIEMLDSSKNVFILFTANQMQNI